MIRFTVPGEPEAKPRPRAYVREGKPGMYQPDAKGGFLERVAYAANPHRPRTPATSPVRLWIFAYFSWPKSWGQSAREEHGEYMDQKPDWDNLGKGVSDVLEECVTKGLRIAGFYDNDKRVADGRVVKKYSDHPRTEVEFEVLT
jgi:Holliday junction resolvase RusA-like endonuclease